MSRAGGTGVARSAAVVLAAGRGSRFGGGKLLAQLDGRPLLQHVLDTVALAELSPVVVVLGHGATELEMAVHWRHERRFRNPDPDGGLAGSVRLGLRALAQSAPLDEPPLERALVVLGDQPRLRADYLRVLLAQPRDEERPLVVPRYQDGQPGNPVLLERAAWALASALEGDRGMAQLFTSRPKLVRYVDVPGTNPDVDTPEDLARLDQARESDSGS